MPTLRNFRLQIAFQLARFMLAGACLVACGGSSETAASGSDPNASEVSRLFETIAKQEIAQSPETATQLGLLPEIAGDRYLAELDDRSEAGVSRLTLQRIETLNSLERLQTEGLPANVISNFQTVKSAYQSAITMGEFGHGQVGLGLVRPYAADQLSGGYIQVPDLLLNRQPVRTLEEAQLYLTRLSELAGTIDDERRRLEADEQKGVRPPRFILDRMSELSAALANKGAATHPLVETLENLLSDLANITPTTRDRILGEAERLVSQNIVPAYEHFAETIEDMKIHASDAPGIWQLPEGEAYYTAALKFYSGQDTSAPEMHNTGLALVEEISLQLEELLAAQGLAEGSIGERLAALGAQPDQLFENDETGRSELISYLQSKISTISAQLGTLIEMPPGTDVSVAPVPDYLAQTAPGGYYVSAPADRSTPATFFINLRDTSEWPIFTLQTLLYHETLPGHHFESAFVSAQADLPLIRQFIWTPAYGEGWAVYAEDLAHELGTYANDPFGELGYLQSLLFRAARLVVDTGLHHERWSRERAIKYLVDITGQPESAMATEVDRYAVWPGQATSYMSGRQILHRLRDQAELILGRDFSLKAFHAVILNNGPRPMALVEQDVNAWIISRLGESQPDKD